MCNSNFSGDDCSIKTCPDNCSGNGECLFSIGRCQCFKGFEGEKCEKKVCLNDCSNNGKCLNGTCICNQEFFGQSCEISRLKLNFIKNIFLNKEKCKNDCSLQGKCINGECHCEKEFKEDDCSKRACINNCYNQGVCTPDKECKCNKGKNLNLVFYYLYTQ